MERQTRPDLNSKPEKGTPEARIVVGFTGIIMTVTSCAYLVLARGGFNLDGVDGGIAFVAAAIGTLFVSSAIRGRWLIR